MTNNHDEFSRRIFTKDKQSVTENDAVSCLGKALV